MGKFHFVLVGWKELWHNLVHIILIHTGMMAMVIMVMMI